MSLDLDGEFPLASPGHRIGAVAVDIGLYVVTFGIGWFVWNLVTMSAGQSPGKQVLKVRVVSEETKQPANWGRMFIRQVLIPFTISIFYLIPYYIMIFKGFVGVPVLALVIEALLFVIFLTVYLIDFIWLFGNSHRRLIDYWAKTYVVNEAA